MDQLMAPSTTGEFGIKQERLLIEVHGQNIGCITPVDYLKHAHQRLGTFKPAHIKVNAAICPPQTCLVRRKAVTAHVLLCSMVERSQ